jgi:V/A-type H+-transporting ATPase subunit F
MKQIVLLTPGDAAQGFALAGVRQHTPRQAEVHRLLRELASDPRTGLVIVDERLADRDVRDCLHELDRRWAGLAIVLPAPRAVVRTEEDYVLQLIRRAIGYQVRLS